MVTLDHLKYTIYLPEVVSCLISNLDRVEVIAKVGKWQYFRSQEQPAVHDYILGKKAKVEYGASFCCSYKVAVTSLNTYLFVVSFLSGQVIFDSAFPENPPDFMFGPHDRPFLPELEDVKVIKYL